LIVKFHNRGTGAGKGPVEYLLGKDGKREKSRLLRGSPEQTVALIDSSLYAKKYTSGVLSFAESDLSDQAKQQIMDSFERALLPGLDSDQFDCLWVEHRDKGRLELNFVIPNLELSSGKRLQPYFDAADRKRVNEWKVLTNAEHSLHDPDDPANKRSLTTANNLPRSHKEAAEAINQGLLALAESGAIRNREDVLRALNDAGFDIARETKSSISIKNPAAEGGKNIRLKGALYERHFEFSKGLQDEIARASEGYRQARTERLERARATLDSCVEKKRAEITRRYPRPRTEFEQVGRRAAKAHKPRRSQELHGSGFGSIFDAVTGRRGPLVAGPKVDRSAAANRSISSNAGQVKQSRRGPQVQPVRQPAVRTDRSECTDVSGQLHDPEGVLNDRAGTDFIERIRATKRAVLEAAQRLRDRAQELVRDIQDYIERERCAARAGDELKQSDQRLRTTAERLDTAFKSLENRVVSVEKLREKQQLQQQYKGPSMSR
jgi:hypothetical protein